MATTKATTKRRAPAKRTYTLEELRQLKTITLEVRPKHCKGARREDCYKCPAANAAKEAVVDCAVTVIGDVRFGIWDYVTGEKPVYFRSNKLQQAVMAFDKGGKFPVGKFRLKRAE